MQALGETEQQMSTEIEVLEDQCLKPQEEGEGLTEIISDEEQDQKNLDQVVSVDCEGFYLIVAEKSAYEVFDEEEWKHFFRQIQKSARRPTSIQKIQENLGKGEGLLMSTACNNKERQQYLRQILSIKARNSIIMVSEQASRMAYWNCVLELFDLEEGQKCECWIDYHRELMKSQGLEESLELQLKQEETDEPQEVCWKHHIKEIESQCTGEKDLKQLQGSLDKMHRKFDFIFEQFVEEHPRQEPQVKEKRTAREPYLADKSLPDIQLFRLKWLEWARVTCLHYSLEDPQVGLNKGMEYVCLAALAHPSNIFPSPLNLAMATKTFLHLMQGQDMRVLYLPGSPRFFKEMVQLGVELKEEAPRLFAKLEGLGLDYTKIFLPHYKTLLLYRLGNLEVIRKIVEMLLVYGIDIMRRILVKILAKRENRLLAIQDGEELGQYIANYVTRDYFSGSNSVQEQFRDLFITR